MVKPVRGSWVEVRHHAEAEGKYWNEAACAFTADQWTTLILDMAALGFEYFVLTSVALGGRAFYPTDLLPRQELGCDDPIEASLAAADLCGARFFIGNDFFGPPMVHGRNLVDPDTIRVRHRAMEELVTRYGHHPSFYGWYYPHECSLFPYFDDDYLHYLRLNSQEARRLKPEGKILIAPYGTRQVIADATFAHQLETIDVDIIAYQDEVGVQKSRAEETEYFFEQLRFAHDQAGRPALWADVELFDFEGEVYKSALLPAPFERIETQLRGVSNYVDVILVYQYQGILSRPGSPSFLGVPDSARLHQDYDHWRKEQSA